MFPALPVIPADLMDAGEKVGQFVRVLAWLWAEWQRMRVGYEALAVRSHVHAACTSVP